MTDRFKNYVSVAERVTSATPDIASIVTDAPVMLTDAMGYIRACVALKGGETATGTASFRLDLQGKSAQATNPLEDAETSAVGRALAFLGYSSSRSIASREDVIEAQRRADAASFSPPVKTVPVPPRQNNTDTNNGADAAEARRKFYERWSTPAGTTWPMVAAFLGIDKPEPSTVDGWREVWRLTKLAADALEAEAALAAEYDAIEAAS